MRGHNTPSTPPNEVPELSVPVSSPFLPTTAAATRYRRYGKSVLVKLLEIEDFCTDHLSPVPQGLQRDDLDSLVQAFQSDKSDARYTSLCKLLNTLSERTGT
jgi:hypothetical protein